jgi:formamidopyrimidine-DNA glycosylase
MIVRLPKIQLPNTISPMPELPEVETIARALRPALEGRRIAAARVFRRDYIRVGATRASRCLTGATINRIEREGKRLWLRLSNGGDCLIHLGMSGRLTLERPQAPIAPHTHLSLTMAGAETQLRVCDPRRFGGVWLFPNGRESTEATLGPLGPDALTVTARDFAGACKGQRPIKALLLDQSKLAGIGNIYADEALFDARIHPLSLADELTTDEHRRLATSIRRVLRRAVQYGGSTLRDYVRADGSMGEFQNVHRVYGRVSKPCVRCKTPIERIIVAQRSTHYCNVCASR